MLFSRIYRYKLLIQKEVSALKEIEKAYTQHAKDVYRYLLSLTHDENLAEELTQETFFRAMRTIDRYDGSCKLSVWLCQIAKHLWYQYLQKNGREIVTDIRDEYYGAMENSTESEVFSHYGMKEILKGMQRLPVQMREVMYLRLTGDLSYKEIGEILGRSENWARVNYYRGKELLWRELRENE